MLLPDHMQIELYGNDYLMARIRNSRAASTVSRYLNEDLGITGAKIQYSKTGRNIWINKGGFSYQYHQSRSPFAIDLRLVTKQVPPVEPEPEEPPAEPAELNLLTGNAPATITGNRIQADVDGTSLAPIDHPCAKMFRRALRGCDQAEFNPQDGSVRFRYEEKDHTTYPNRAAMSAVRSRSGVLSWASDAPLSFVWKVRRYQGGGRRKATNGHARPVNGATYTNGHAPHVLHQSTEPSDNAKLAFVEVLRWLMKGVAVVALMVPLSGCGLFLPSDAKQTADARAANEQQQRDIAAMTIVIPARPHGTCCTAQELREARARGLADIAADRAAWRRRHDGDGTGCVPVVDYEGDLTGDCQ